MVTTAVATIPDLLGTSPADLIDRYVDLPVAARDVAVRRAERIRAGVASYAAMRQDIADAYAQRDWLALDYDSWHAYLEGEFGQELRALSRVERREAVADLRTQGMSTRQIASVTGQAQTQVVRDLRQVNTKDSPATVSGADGKEYPAVKPPRPETPARRDPEPSVPPVVPAIATPGGPDTPAPADAGRTRRPVESIVSDLHDAVAAIMTGLVTTDTVRALREAADWAEAEL